MNPSSPSVTALPFWKAICHTIASPAYPCRQISAMERGAACQMEREASSVWVMRLLRSIGRKVETMNSRSGPNQHHEILHHDSLPNKKKPFLGRFFHRMLDLTSGSRQSLSISAPALLCSK